MSFIDTLRTVFLQLSLLSPQCFDSLVVKMQFNNSECLKMLISRGLGLGIVAGATCVKLPQIIKIYRSGSAKGISFLGTLLELIAVTASGAYSFSNGFPFSAYGEAVFLALETSLVAIFILWFKGNSFQTLLFSLIYSATSFAILSPGLVPADVLWFGQAANIPMIVLGKLIQVKANYSQGHTGQLSAITVILLTLGKNFRDFTSF